MITHVCEKNHMFAVSRKASICPKCNGRAGWTAERQYYSNRFGDFMVFFNGITDTATAKLLNYRHPDLIPTGMDDAIFITENGCLIAADWWEEVGEDSKAHALRSMWIHLGTFDEVFHMDSMGVSQILLKTTKEKWGFDMPVLHDLRIRYYD